MEFKGSHIRELEGVTKEEYRTGFNAGMKVLRGSEKVKELLKTQNGRVTWRVFCVGVVAVLEAQMIREGT